MGLGTEGDIVFSRSANNGQSWSPAAPLNSNAATDSGVDAFPDLATDGTGQWVAAWTSADSLGNTIGTDNDILIARSGNNGATWNAPTPLNINAATDSGTDDFPRIACDLNGRFMAVWESRDTLGNTIGTDRDVLCARFALPDCNANFIPDIGETDCNTNGVPDSCDIAAGASVDTNANGIPDECETPVNPCPADCNVPHNSIVNIDDLVTVIINWGSTAPNNPADVNHSGIVGIDDLVQVITHWGPCP
jgi:hypothetical protein